MPKRPKRQYIRWDVHFGDLPLGLELLERFGPWGHCLFLGFICACKKHHIRGRISYASESEGLAVLGYPCAHLVDAHGEPFTLDDFWAFLGKRKQTRRTRRGRVTNVVSTRWEEWQNDWRRADSDERKSWSEADSTDPSIREDKKREETTAEAEPDPWSEGKFNSHAVVQVREQARRLFSVPADNGEAHR